ncbi:MerR family transcriptional regulator [Methylobacterium gnaphalii]|uniref:HTH merR-type domain-containing protein n=1 Tax=Methylobacterium gnaphalii TaxID=1010610 RepID=A0A512JH17_9HYPH|nr:hypothetical protein MGN01_11140 [Methylobacterium gnaphalii]GJD69050.1 hypothetical protein MMMDOFMJ_1976 [Methylobacterium gnaphalii]GLS50998.1 hypothetical protein GCM10007885_38520 [Methylobacterium gnaphalii]
MAASLKLPSHVLAYWRTKFPLIRPLVDASGRYRYATNDLYLIRGIQHLVYVELYSIRGAQRILRLRGVEFVRAIGRGEASAVSG